MINSPGVRARSAPLLQHHACENAHHTIVLQGLEHRHEDAVELSRRYGAISAGILDCALEYEELVRLSVVI